MILRNFISLQAFIVYTEKSLRFEISFWSIWPKWNLHQSEFHYAWSDVNVDNKVASHQSQISSRSETGLSSLQDKISLRCEVTLYQSLMIYVTTSTTYYHVCVLRARLHEFLKWTQTGLKSQTALKCRSIYMAIHMEISLQQLSKQ